MAEHAKRQAGQAGGGTRRRIAILVTVLLTLAAVALLVWRVGFSGSQDQQSLDDATPVAEETASGREGEAAADTADGAIGEASNEDDQAAEAPAADPVAEARARLDLTERYYPDLQHGDKGAAFQRYIVLHDTEGDSPADGVLSYWEGNGNLVAAHFVVNKDGSILQCVPMDRIAHHAGWGSGNADERFGITEDGRDDLLGRKPSGSYTDYGMNAWSIGIEMVHVGGEDYPEAQLEAVDDLVAYIDAYYGGSGGMIIDHKAWRAGNSDTNPEFAGYLANYQDHRSHD